MSIDSLHQNIHAAQNKDKVAMGLIINQFHPLINKYANFLKGKFGCEYDDAYSDIIYEFIKMIYSVPLEKFKSDTDIFLLAYIKKSVMHTYQFYGKKAINNSIRDLKNIYECTDNVFHDINNLIFIQDIKSLLTSQEFKVIYLYIYDDISISDIAIRLNISRQYVNKTKNIAYKKIKDYTKGGDT